MAYRFEARSTTPGDYNFKAGSLGFIPAAADVRDGVDRGDGTLGTLTGTGVAVTAPTMTIVDNADGTGAVATISGGDAGSTHTVYTQAFNGYLGTTTWTSGGSRSGNGTVALSRTAGHYLAYCKAAQGTDTAVSQVVYFVVTDATDPNLNDCLTAVQARIQSLLLAGVANSSIVVRKLAWIRGNVSPGIYVCPVQETRRPATNQSVDVGYGAAVVMVRASNQELTANIDVVPGWREAIVGAFENHTLTGVNTVYQCEIEPGPVFDPGAFANQYEVGALVVRCISRELN